jgi:hypothetical protein
MVRLKVGSISLSVSSQIDEHHSTLLCWRKRTSRWGGVASDFTIDKISSGVLSGSPLLACKQANGSIRQLTNAMTAL